MQTLFTTCCIILLLALSYSATAQPAPGSIPKAKEGPEQAIHSIPLPPPPGETVHTTYCPMKIGKIPLRDKPLKVNYSRKPRARFVVPDDTVAEEKRVVIVNSCQDASAAPAPSVGNAPPPPPPPRIICEDIFRVVEESPRFPGCEHLPTLAEKKQCANEKLLEFIYDNITYPKAARKNGIEGTVVIKFVVEKDGSVTDARAIRDIGGGCGQEALRVVKLMNQPGLRWTPGKQIGRPVRTQFNIPVKFILEGHVEFCASSVTEECSIMEKPATEAPLNAGYEPPPPSPCQLAPQEEEVFRIVEEMPRFPCPECEALPTRWEKKQCSDKKLLEFLYQNLTYPALAREDCVAGTVVIQFVVEKDGAVTNAKIVRDIGAYCGEAALGVVNLMSERSLKWIPGTQRGRTVRVQFYIPVKFRIECPDTPPAPGPAGQDANKEQADEALPPAGTTPSGTPLPLAPEGFRLFPNPAADWLQVRFRPMAGPVSLTIVNAFGQVLWRQEYNHHEGILEERANLAGWPSGTYFLRIEQGGAVRTHPFVKQR